MAKRAFRSLLMVTSAVMALTTTPASAQACDGCVVGAVQSAAQAIVAALTVGPTSVTGAIALSTQQLLQTISGNQEVQTNAYERLLTAQQNQQFQAYAQDRELVETRRFVTSPKSCYTVTAAAALPASRAGAQQIAPLITSNQTDWGTGQNGAPTAKGKGAGADVLIAGHQQRVGSGPDSNDWAMNLAIMMNAKTLTDPEITGTGGGGGGVSGKSPQDPDHPNGPSGWVRDMAFIGFDPHPQTYDTKNATAAQKLAAITRQSRLSFARAPFEDSQARRRATPTGGPDLKAWVIGLFKQAGMTPPANLPANPSWQEIMNTLVTLRFGGTDWHLQLSKMTPEQIARENLEMQSVMLQLQWAHFQYEEKVGAMQGNMYAHHLDGG